MSAKLENKLGTIVYTDNYLGTLAGMAATESYGVVGMSSKKVTDGLVELLGKENLQRGVKIFSDESDVIRIELNIVVQYGISIGTSASSIIETVKYTVEKATGLTVSEVNVVISGIRVQA